MQNWLQASAAMLSKIGIKVDLKTMPKAQYLAWIWPMFSEHDDDRLALQIQKIQLTSGKFLTMTT